MREGRAPGRETIESEIAFMESEAVSLRRVHVTDLHQVLPYLPFLEPEYVQLACGNFDAEFFGVEFPHGAAWGSRANLGFLGTAGVPPGYQLFAFSVPGSEDRWDGRLVDQNGLAVGYGNRAIQHRAGDNHRIMGWMFPSDLYIRVAEKLGMDDVLPQGEPWVAADVRGLRNLLKEIFAHAAMSQFDASLLEFYETALIELTLSTLHQAGSRQNGCRLRTGLATEVRRWLDAKAESCVNVSQLCAEFGISERTLRHHFALEFDVSPSQYHQAVRLSRARESLLASNPRKGVISQVATTLGFWHMGRFGEQYRRYFGETPSETLQRAPSNSGRGFFSLRGVAD